MLVTESMEEEFEGSNNDRTHRIVVRGKRTKRHRTASPYGLGGAGTCSSSSGGGGGGGGGSGGDYVGSTSSGGGEVYESTEEEEDMANCLILLAQGRGGAPAEKKVEEGSGRRQASSRKFTEIMASTAAETAGKVGFYVYECKTCNRTFPSFQALGGHRASHKKPKTAPPEAKKPAVTAAPVSFSNPILQSSTVTTDHDHDRFEDAVVVKLNKTDRSTAPPPTSHQFTNQNNSKPNKIHECSICGAEFTSGQALGGHMRRHRAAAAATSATTTDTSATTTDQPRRDQEEKKETKILQLDLNLPAPEVDDQRESSTSSSSKFQFSPPKQQQQQSIVFSAPALVDCHY